MNTPGYMLVLTGTPTLFPLIDEVFSPIVRQFKKINVMPFKNTDETQDCIKKPLEKLGISLPDAFDYSTYVDVRDIHDLSGGRPYEIQLLCHKLFKRAQDRRAPNMKLSLTVLEDVIKELETSQDINVRPTLMAIRNLTKDQLKALNLLCACNGRATFEHIWTIEYVVIGEKNWSRTVLDELKTHLMEKCVLSLEDGIIIFQGDDFDKIYTKYYAREQGIRLSFPDFSPEAFYWLRTEFQLNKSGASSLVSPFEPDRAKVDLKKVIDLLSDEHAVTDVFVESPRLASQLYNWMINCVGCTTAPVIHLSVKLPWLNGQCWYHSKDPKDVNAICQCLPILELMKARAKDVGGELFHSKEEVGIVPIDILTAKVTGTRNENLRQEIAESHFLKAYDCYLEKKDKKSALFNVKLAHKYSNKLSWHYTNDLGYISMGCGH